jgi:putative SOS response-associated peptidase YedK
MIEHMFCFVKGVLDTAPGIYHNQICGVILMCGRFSLIPDLDALQLRFQFQEAGLSHHPRYNIAPSQEVLTVIKEGVRNHAQFMKWGLIPSWARDPAMGNRMINVRAETVAEKPSFRQAFQRRRCLVPADGFYEWRRDGKHKVPMRIIIKSGEPFGFAGLWETWESPWGQMVKSCTIITTTANPVLEPIHHRMPVIMPREAEGLWLDVTSPDTAPLRQLLVPYAPEEMRSYAVSALVNSPAYDSPVCIAPV